MAKTPALNSTPRLYKKVALVYDRVNKFGGAERVLTALHLIYPDAPLYTLVHNPPTASWAKNFKVIPTFFNKLNWLRTHHEVLAPLSALAFETFNFDAFDLVISITSADAKAIITKPKTMHLCYCLTPTRYLWSGQKDYRLIRPYLRWAQRADLVSSSRPDYYLAISKEVQRRIENYYARPSAVVYPGIDYDFFSEGAEDKRQGYYLVVSRQVAYKKTDIVIEAFNKLKKKLLVVGDGTSHDFLRSIAGKNIEFLTTVDDQELRKIYHKAQALIFPQDEDFGLVPLEAQASGTPVLAYAAGGALETIIPDKTGLFFESQSPNAIITAVHHFEEGKHDISTKNCCHQAQLFSQDRFFHNFSAKVNSLWPEYLKRNS